MLYIIYPSDVTTEFLLKIPRILEKRVGTDVFRLIVIETSEESYRKTFETISELPSESLILFMGHGQNDCLYGAESTTFPKREFINLKTVKVLANKYVFLLSCYSSEFLKSSFRYSNIIKSVGFGILPSDMSEVNKDKRLLRTGANASVLEDYKNLLVELVAQSFSDIIERDLPFIDITSFFLLRLNKKIVEVVLNRNTERERRALSDLLFYLKSEMIVV